MNRTLASVIAALMCACVIALVVALGYSRYRAAKQREAAYGETVQQGAGDVSRALTGGASGGGEVSAKMPEQLRRTVRSTPAAEESATP